MKKYFDENSVFYGLESLPVIPDDLGLSNEETVSIGAEAEKVMKHVYNILGSGDTKLDPIDWHVDFKTGHRWPPGIFFRDYIQVDPSTDSDVKVPRELSRCHHLLKVGVSYRLTHEEKYAEFCIRQMENWIRENPLMRSINWGCTMDVSIRAVNWLWTLRLIEGSSLLTGKVVKKIWISLYEHGWFIFRNPEKNEFNNHNHYLSDLSGQIILGLVFQHMEEPKEWLENGKRELFREMRSQILPTGMSYERSTNYHRLVIELLIVPILLLKKNNHEIPSDIWYRVEKMFEFLLFAIRPDGHIPIIGDQDDGRLLPFGCESNTDYRYLLSLGSILFNRRDFKSSGNGWNIYCSLLGGSDSREKFNIVPGIKEKMISAAFPDAGFFVMRKGDNYLLFNASGKSLYSELPGGTHTHSDLLSFELYTNGKPFLVDPGSFVYSADATQRMLFRTTRMHNTATVDSESQNKISREILWDFERNAIPEIINWSSEEDCDIIIAKHSGYLRLPHPVIHQRKVTFSKVKTAWMIEDNFTGEGNHLFECFFHFGKGIDFSINDSEIKTHCEDGKDILIKFEASGTLKLEKEKSYISRAYGVKEEGLVLVVSLTSVCPAEIITEIIPILKDETNF